MKIHEDTTVAELGESGVLKLITPRLPKATAALLGPGDDSAVLAVPSGQSVISTDTMIEGNDFRLDWSSGYELGFKAAVTNLTDIAAMGAKPTALVIALALPKTLRVQLLLDFADGVAAACKQLAPGTGVIGGDLALAERFTIAVTVFGEPVAPSVVLRSGARAGQVIAVAGRLGWASAGLRLLFEAEQLGRGIAELREQYPQAIRAQLTPEPPVQAAVAAGGTATAMMDLSDGLVIDSYRICEASGVGFDFDSAAIAAEAALLEPLSGFTPEENQKLVLFGGEDHSFLAVFPENSVASGFRVIGRVIEQQGVFLDGETLPRTGWDHFAS